MTTDTAVDPLASLSPRQRQVVELLGQGHKITAIAVELGCSRRTVESHAKNASSRLGIIGGGVWELRMWAVRHSLKK